MSRATGTVPERVQLRVHTTEPTGPVPEPFHCDHIARWSARSGTTGRSGTGVNTGARLRSGTVPVPKLWCEHGLRAPRFSPSLPLLKQLHWLPVNYIIKFKLSTLTYRALAIHQPPYLASLLHVSNVPRQLRSSTSQQLSIPRTKLNLGKRAFSVAAPIIWNELPTTLKSCESLASFRKNLKTYLFKIAFPP